jgi:hypothetical protein
MVAVRFGGNWEASVRMAVIRRGVGNLGAPIAYGAVPIGAPVYDRDGARVGTVEQVLADEGSDIFHGLIVRPQYLLDGAVFASREQIGGLYEHGVVLTVSGTDLHVPDDDTVAANAADASAGERVRERLRRARRWLQRRR